MDQQIHLPQRPSAIHKTTRGIHGGIVHHLGVGNTHRDVKILLLIDEVSVTVTDLDTGEVLSEHDIDEARNYWRNRLREPGRWPQ